MSEADPYRLPENPYAPPEAPLAPDFQPPVYVGALEPFSPANVWRRSYEIYKRRTGLVFGLAVLPQVVAFVYQYASGIVTASVGADNPGGQGSVALAIGFAVVGYVLQFWLSAGMVVGLLKVARNQDAAIGDLFSGGRYLLPTIWATIVYAVAGAGVAVVGLLPAAVAYVAFGQSSPAVPVLTVVLGLVVVGFLIYCGIRLYTFQYALVDSDLGGVEALRTSWRLTEGRALAMFEVILRASFLNLLGLLVFCVGVLYTGPLSLFMLANAYVLLAGGEVGGAGKPAHSPVYEL